MKWTHLRENPCVSEYDELIGIPFVSIHRAKNWRPTGVGVELISNWLVKPFAKSKNRFKCV